MTHAEMAEMDVLVVDDDEGIRSLLSAAAHELDTDERPVILILTAFPEGRS